MRYRWLEETALTCRCLHSWSLSTPGLPGLGPYRISAMDSVCNDHEALIITRNGEQSVVMLSLEDYKALEETACLLRTPANARRLLSAAAQLNAGKGVERKLAK